MLLFLVARKNHQVLRLFRATQPKLIVLTIRNGHTCGRITAMNGNV